MTASAPAAQSRRPLIEPSLLALAAIAWVATIAVARDMGNGPGTMGLGVVAFIGSWTLMMAAMMFPSIAPFASLYTRTFIGHRGRRVGLLAGGYLAVWATAGLGAFALARGAEELAERAPGWAHGAAVASCFACALYQVTPLKDRCLQHCRSPLGHLVRYASFRRRLADTRVGIAHGGWCLACCWSLMLLLVTFGVMNVIAMVSLAAVIVTEKIAKPGRWFSIAVGAGALALGVAIWIDPSIAHGLYLDPTQARMDM